VKTIFVWSPKAFALLRTLIVFVTGLDSPVKDASSTLSSVTSKSLESAGTLSPSSKRIISPGTTSIDFISNTLLFLRTLVFDSCSFLKCSIAFSALNS